MEQTIFSHLISNDGYARTVIPHLKEEYFQDNTDRVIYTMIDAHITKYDSIPTKEVLLTNLDDIALSEYDYQEVQEKIAGLSPDDKSSTEWLVDKTEEFCQDRAIHTAILQSIEVAEGESKNLTKSSIPGLLTDALSVSFDNRIGHDFLEDSAARLKYYQQEQVRVSFDIEYLNLVTRGGLLKKTLMTILAGTGVGKSAIMCHMATHNIRCGKNVLYISMEMSEEQTAQRMDANMLDVSIEEFETIDPAIYTKRMDELKKTVKGQLFIKEYAPGSASAAHFRHLLDELKLKKKFVPDVVYVDYVNLCASSRFKQNMQNGSYGYIKAVAEELRAIAVDYDLPLITATQLNRGGMSSSDVGLEDTSESVGLPMTTDYMFGVVSTEELEDMGCLMFKQLKNRYNDVNFHRKFMVGMNRRKMRLHDITEAQLNVVKSRGSGLDDDDDTPVMDNTQFGQEDDARNQASATFGGLRKRKGWR